jgi:hypothetical protein
MENRKNEMVWSKELGIYLLPKDKEKGLQIEQIFSEPENKYFYIGDIDGCEFVKSTVVGKMMISHHQDFDGIYTGKIHVIYSDGSQTTKSREEAQKYINTGEWTIIR